MMRRLYFMRVSFEFPLGIVRNSLLWFCVLQQRFFSADGTSALQKIRYYCYLLVTSEKRSFMVTTE